ncbi:MAG TPA: c-type cytochrome [Anaerolineales bacterium]
MNRFSKLAGLLVIALSFGIIVVPLISSFSWRSHTIHARMAEKGGWTPQTIEARAGVPITLHLTSDDVVHGFAVGQMDMEPVDIEPGKLTDVTLTFDRPGTYTFYCTRWCGLNHWRMRGTIEVTGSEPGPALTPARPLYVSLGIDPDAPHPAAATPRTRPSAVRGAEAAGVISHELVAFLEHYYYRTHSPTQVFAELKSTSLTDAQRWDVVAHIWASNTSTRDVEEGRRLFAQNCAACHGERGGGDGVFADDLERAGASAMSTMNGAQGMSMQAPANLADAGRILGASPALLQGKILRGGMGTGMPMWGSIFTDEQTWNIVAYLYSLQFNYKP